MSSDPVTMSVETADAAPLDRSAITDEEWDIRVELAACYRLVAHYGWDDLVFTHLSARVPGPEHHFLINPYGLGFDEITASTLVKIDLEGNPVIPTAYPVNAAGFTIHGAVHEHAADANCVIHTHSDDGVAVSAQADGLMPLSQTAMLIREDVAYHDYEGVALDHAERERLLADLGDKHCMILRNHGLMTSGISCSDAFMRLYVLERACTYQIKALSAGYDRLNMPNQGVAEHTARQLNMASNMSGQSIAWPALLRILERTNPGYDA